MRILHTADWHIGRQFHNVSLLEDQRQVLDQIITMIGQRQIDVVLVAGDIYDRSVPSAEAVVLLDDVINRISNELGVPLILIAGNHDGPDRLAFNSRLLSRSGVYIQGPLQQKIQPVILTDEHGEVAFYCIPYADPAMVRDVYGVDLHTHDECMKYLTDTVRQDNSADRRCVVLCHCFVIDGSTSESERPLSVGGADQVDPTCFNGFQYVALGHLHSPKQKLPEHIRYAGSILKYSFSEEKHTKSVTITELDADGNCSIEEVALALPRDLRIIEGKLKKLLKAGKTDPHNDDYLLVRLTDRKAILDPMGKLREVYPNVLHLEKLLPSTGSKNRVKHRKDIRHGHLPMFREFYRQMTGDKLDKESTALITNILDQLHGRERSDP